MPAQQVGIFVLYSGMVFVQQHRVFLFLFIVSGVLRLLPLFNYQFTFDELSGLDRTQFNSFNEVLQKGVKIDAHPALVQLIIYYLSSFFGYVNWIIKLPFLIMGQMAIVYAYLFGLKNFSKQSGLIAASFLSFSLIFVFYAPIARMYISGVFFSLGLLFHFYQVFFQNQKTFKHFFMMALFAWLSALNHHMSALFAFTVFGAGFFLMTKHNAKAFLLSCLLCILCYLPHLMITLYQLSVPGIGAEQGGWLMPPNLSSGFEFVKVLLGTGSSYLIVLGLVVVSMVVAGMARQMRGHHLLFILFLINFLIIYSYSVLRSPIFQFSVMMFCGTALILWLSALMDVHRPGLNGMILVFLSGTLIYQTYIRKNYFHNAVQTVYEYQFERSAHYSKQFGSNNLMALYFDCDTLMKKLYYKKHHCDFDLKMSADAEINYGNKSYFVRKNRAADQDSLISSTQLFSEFVASLKQNYLAVASCPPFYQALIEQHFPYLIENTQTQAVDFKFYARKPSGKTVAPDETVYFCMVPGCGEEKSLPLYADSLNEFPFAVKMPYNRAVLAEGQTVLTYAEIQSDYLLSNNLELVISTNDLKKDENLLYSGKSAGDFIQAHNGTITMIAEQYAGTTYQSIKDRSRLSSFIWNRSRRPFTLKSFQIKTVNYWPLKWNWWK